MGGRRVGRTQAAVAVLGAVMLAFPAFFLTFGEPLAGYEMEVIDLNSSSPALRALSSGPFGLRGLDRPGAIEVGNLTVSIDGRLITTVGFTLGLGAGEPAVALKEVDFRLSASNSLSWMVEERTQYYALVPGEYDRAASFSVLEDPGGHVKRGRLAGGDVLEVTLPGVGLPASSELRLGTRATGLATEYIQVHAPPFITNPPFECDAPVPFVLNVTNDGRDRPGPRDWVVSGPTLLENTTLGVDGRIIILENGSLQMNNVTILMNSSLEPFRLFELNGSLASGVSGSLAAPELGAEFFSRGLPFVNLSRISRWGELSYIVGTDGGRDFCYLFEESGDSLWVLDVSGLSPSRRVGIYLARGGELSLRNCTVNRGGEAAREAYFYDTAWHAGFDIELFGRARFENTTISIDRNTSCSLHFHAEDAEVACCKIFGSFHCIRCSPDIHDTTFTGAPEDGGHLQDCSATLRGNRFLGVDLEVVGRSWPRIVNNTFEHERTAVMLWDQSDPLVANNTIRAGTGVNSFFSFGSVLGNDIEASGGGIRAFGSSLVVRDNDIASPEPVTLEYWATADIEGNRLSGHARVAVNSSNAFPLVGANEYRPNSTSGARTLAVEARQYIDLDIRTERRGRAERQELEFVMEHDAGYGKGERERWDFRKGHFYGEYTLFEQAEDGKRTDHAPFRLTIKKSFWTFTVPLKLNATYQLAIMLRERWYDIHLTVALAVLGTSLIAAPFAPFARDRYHEWRARRPAVGHVVTVRRHEEPGPPGHEDAVGPHVVRIPDHAGQKEDGPGQGGPPPG